MSLDSDLRARFISGMSHAAATVNVVTTDGQAGGRAGVTVSAMSSVSADSDRPTLLICVNKASASAAAILSNGVFCVNVLKDHQSYISDVFAGRFRDQLPDKFDCAEWAEMSTGALRVRDPLVAFDCHVVSSDLVGTHHVFIGEVADVFIASHGSPLIYAKRAYGAANRIESPGSIGAGRSAAENRLTLACFYTLSPVALPELFLRLATDAPEVSVNLIEGDQSRIHAALAAGEAELGLMYDEDISDSLDKDVLVERNPYVLVAADHPLASKDRISASDLDGQPMVLLNTPPSPDYFLGLLRDAGAEPRIIWQSAMVETVRGMVANNLGFALLASRPTNDHSYDGKPLAIRPLDWPAKPSRIVLVRRKDAALSPAAERLAQLCRDDFEAGPA